MRSKRYKNIIEENKKFEKETPYNFCDQWCKHCSHEKQMCCKLYQDELEQIATCIAHGRDPDDPEITEEVIRRQYEDDGEEFEEITEDNLIDLDEIDDPEFEPIRKHIKFVQTHPLPGTAEQYQNRAHQFLGNTFYDKKINPNLCDDFEIIAWYHTLLPSKLQRALAGFHEPVSAGEFALYDSVAQFIICKKAINASVKSLRKLKEYYPEHKTSITELLALLHNIFSRIEKMEERV